LHLIEKWRKYPVFEENFNINKNNNIDFNLNVGSVFFGLGFGII